MSRRRSKRSSRQRPYRHSIQANQWRIHLKTRRNSDPIARIHGDKFPDTIGALDFVHADGVRVIKLRTPKRVQRRGGNPFFEFRIGATVDEFLRLIKLFFQNTLGRTPRVFNLSRGEFLVA